MAINYGQNFVFNGLGTLAFSVPNTGTYNLHGDITLPTLVNGGGVSALVVNIEVNNVEVYEGEAGATGFTVQFSATANQVVEVIFSSAAAPDLGLNVIKSTISISPGE